MALDNKLGLTSSADLDREEECISKKKARELSLRTRMWLYHILKNEIGKVIDWSKIDKEDYLLAMERSPIKDVELKVLVKNALTDEINSREVFMKGLDHSYYYEGYTTFKTEELC